jgi:Sulfotransferase family
MPLGDRKVNLFIVGAAKCGTTSLHYYLSQHPDIFMSPVKEPNYFSELQPDPRVKFLFSSISSRYQQAVIKDDYKYQALFDSVIDEKWIGEASTSYFIDKQSAQKIYTYNPDARIIVLIRDPVERAYSEFCMDKNSGEISRETTFEKMFMDYQAGKFNRMGLYIENSKYDVGIRRYTDCFPSKQIYIAYTENFKKDSKTEIEKVFSFLGIPFSSVNLDAQNEGLQLNPKLQQLRHLLVQNGLYFVLPEKIKRSLKTALFTKRYKKEQIDEKTKQFFIDVVGNANICPIDTDTQSCV